ncbi:hypothetical protein SCUCBS95973_008402 [Sporothrix curviconia]|uniref:Zn(2)-C6 fungal-type domain-containing protein n=1 Tax=Sporothrix curviconia TaxID=1260050 RepID=A0ABP0CLA9_9PEZI
MPAKRRTASTSTAATTTASTPGGEARPRGKPRGRRRDRDCVTCKTRGLKCDLNRPQCLPCVQAGLSCGGYPMRVVWLDQRRSSASTSAKASKKARTAAPSASTSPRSPPLPSSASPTFTLTSTACSSSPPAVIPVSPASSTMSSTMTLSSVMSSNTMPISTMATAATASTTPPGPYPLIEKPWCETDQNSLIKRLAALCNHILTAETHSTATTADEYAMTYNADPAGVPNPSHSTYSAYYAAHPDSMAPTTTTTAHHISAARKNQYLSLPETTGLLSDLCVFIQARLEGRSMAPRQQPPDSLEMVKHRLAALAHVNRAIAAANPFAFLGIATFAVFEVCDDATFGEWQRHLYGARHLLDYHRCQTLADLQRLAAMVPGLMDILARLVWFDVSGAVVHGAVDGPLLSDVDEVMGVDGGDNTMGIAAGPHSSRNAVASSTSATPASPGLIFDDWHRQVLLDDEFFATVGVPADACALYVDVAKARLDQRPVQACLRATEQLLRLATGPELTDWELSSNVNRCAAALATLRQAHRTQQAQRARQVPPDEEADESAEEELSWETTTAAAVDKLCAALAATPASSRFYIHLAVGAYVAGMQARTREQCAVIRQYWRNCNVCGISRYPGGLARCEEHWRRIGLLGDAEVETGAA